jgi:hypothetical protein
MMTSVKMPILGAVLSFASALAAAEPAHAAIVGAGKSQHRSTPTVVDVLVEAVSGA